MDELFHMSFLLKTDSIITRKKRYHVREILQNKCYHTQENVYAGKVTIVMASIRTVTVMSLKCFHKCA